MRSYLFFLIAIAGMILLVSWDHITENQIKRAEWLLGTWENKTTRGSVYETWKKISDTEFFGHSYMLQGKDTLFFENIELIQDMDSLFFIPTVNNQNQGMPVQFALIAMTDTSMLFRQPYHDFPQMIRYVRITKDSLEAFISGIQNGEERSIVFPMKRVH